MTTQQLDFLNALSQALCNGTETTDPVILKEARDQAVYALMSLDDEAGQIVANNTQLAWEQQKLEEIFKDIPYVILKGTAAAIYYPEPIRRTLGDIDLMVSPEDFQRAHSALQDAGYRTSDPADEISRHAHFFREQVTLELHRRFGTLQTEEQEKIFNQWIIENIPYAVPGRDDEFTFPMLPDQMNGLVLLVHINQHLEEGLGIRQIVDWIMYIRHSLSDTAWPSFQKKTDQLGLTKLAKVSARLGQLYLGMNEKITWCRDIQDSLADDLLEYLFECGNFGKKDPASNKVAMVLSHGRGVKGFFRNLQQRGTANWKRLEKASWLKPFAWAYQLGRYIKFGFRTTSIRDIGRNIGKSANRNQLLDNLEATRLAFRTEKTDKTTKKN